MKKLLSIALCVVMLAGMSTSFCFAAASDPTQTVSAYITVPVTPIDVLVPDKITMTAVANSPTLTITDYTVKNQSALGTIQVDSLDVTAVTGWTLVADTENFTEMAANSKKFSFMHGTHDFAAAATENLSNSNTAAPGVTATFSFSGKTGIVTSAINDVKVADVVATLGYL